MVQLEGKSAKPKEIVIKMQAAVMGTPEADMLSSKYKRKRILGALPQGANALTSTQGESIEQRRNGSLTYEQYHRPRVDLPTSDL